MIGSPLTPLFLKGALVIFFPPDPTPKNFVVFQYNPESLSRTFQTQNPPNPYLWDTTGDTQFVLPPIEQIQASVELDATDQLEHPLSSPVAVAAGLHPALAALELTLYPRASDLITQRGFLRNGMRVAIPAEQPLVMLIWGPGRIMLVRVTSLSVTEQAFDQRLNPIQAKVDLGMRSLSSAEAQSLASPFDTLEMIGLRTREVFAALNIGGQVAQQVSGLLPF